MALAALLLAVLLNLCAGMPAAARTAEAGVSQFTIRGRGLGHGVGMSQWGAEDRGRAWGPITIGLRRLRAVFPGLAANITSVDIVRNNGCRAVTVTFKGRGWSYAVPGSLFQERLGLASTYLSVTPVYGR